MDDAIWMTPAARAGLEAELAEIEGRPETGDGSVRARILELRKLLRSADAGTKPDDGLVEPGMIVTVRSERDGSESRFLLGAREVGQLDPNIDVAVYSPTSPLGAAISGHYVGDIVDYESPAGARRVTILSATPFA